jgi:hypothetical protein
MPLSEKAKKALGDCRPAQVDVYPVNNGFVLKIGPAAICLDREAAEEILILLGEALLDICLGDVVPRSSN